MYVCRLSDYGFSKDENYHSAPGSRVGTPAYLAPEVISNVTGGSYDAKASLEGREWGLGAGWGELQIARLRYI